MSLQCCSQFISTLSENHKFPKFNWFHGCRMIHSTQRGEKYFFLWVRWPFWCVHQAFICVFFFINFLAFWQKYLSDKWVLFLKVTNSRLTLTAMPTLTWIRMPDTSSQSRKTNKYENRHAHTKLNRKLWRRERITKKRTQNLLAYGENRCRLRLAKVWAAILLLLNFYTVVFVRSAEKRNRERERVC